METHESKVDSGTSQRWLGRFYRLRVRLLEVLDAVRDCQSVSRYPSSENTILVYQLKINENLPCFLPAPRRPDLNLFCTSDQDFPDQHGWYCARMSTQATSLTQAT